MVSFLDEPLERFLERVAAREPTPGGGAVAAVTARRRFGSSFANRAVGRFVLFMGRSCP